MKSLSYNILLNKKGYEPFLDFLKGVCIVFVILTHCISPSLHKYSLFCLWGDMAVPLFLVVQVFQTYKKGTSIIKINVTKLLKRIVVPFLIAQVAGVAVLSLVGYPFLNSLRQFGDIGPGAFYPYIYLQFAVLLWLVSSLFNKVKKVGLLLFLFLVVSELLELVSIYLPIGPSVYRFLFFRYTFLIFLAWLLTKGGIAFKPFTIVLAIVSAVFILLFDGIIRRYNLTGGVINSSSMFYDRSFAIFHWISYFYVVFFLLFIIYGCFRLFEKTTVLKNYFVVCGKYSYEIFLFQMVFFLISPVNVLFQKLVGTSLSLEPISLVINVVCCTVPVILIMRLINNKKHKTKVNVQP